MENQDYAAGSRAIKIPISRLKEKGYAIPPRHRSKREERTHRSRNDEGSGSGSGSDAGSAQSSRTRDTILNTTTKMMASPANAQPNNLSFTTPDHKNDLARQRKDKHRAIDLAPPNSVPARVLHQANTYSSPLSPSMLSSSSYKSINLSNRVGDPDEPARIITYTKHSQGFTWNDELFLPSYMVGRRYRGSKARRRWGAGYDEDEDMEDENDIPFDEEADRCPVTDIFVTDEEAAAMLP